VNRFNVALNTSLTLLVIVSTACDLNRPVLPTPALPASSQRPGGPPSAISTPTIQVIPSGGSPEKVVVSTEIVHQPNCGGGGAVINELARSRTIAHTVELGGSVSVNASGEAGIPGVGSVQVGTEIAAKYGVTYGQEDTISRGLTVTTKEGTNIDHTIQQVEYWQTGEIIITDANREIGRYPYKFRDDFGIEYVGPTPLDCGFTPMPTDTPEKSFLEKISGSYKLMSWNEAPKPITLWMDVKEGTLTIDQTGVADWELVIQERGESATPEPRIRCRGKVSISSQQLEAVPGPGNESVDWTSDIGSIRESVWLSFCGWTLSIQQGELAAPFTLHIEEFASGESILEMRNSEGTFTWSK
jgi:hypothetical protein